MAKTRKDAAIRRASARAKGRERTRMATPGRMVEAGVGLGNIARGIARLAGSRAGQSAARGATTAKKAAPAAKKATAVKKAAAKKTTAARRPTVAQVTTASERAQMASMRNLRNTGALARQQAREAAARSSRTRMQGRLAGGAAAGVGVAGAAAAAATQRGRRSKGKMPIRPGKKK